MSLIPPGPLDVYSADIISRMKADVDRLNAEVQRLRPLVSSPPPNNFLVERFPALVTTVDTSSSRPCTWTRQDYDTLGQRTTGYVTYSGDSLMSPAYAVGSPICAANLPMQVEMRRRIPIISSTTGSTTDLQGVVYEFDNPTTQPEVVAIISTASNTFGYPSRVQQWDSSAGTFSDFNAVTVYTTDPNGGTFSAGQKVGVSKYLGPNSSGEDCFSSISASGTSGVGDVVGGPIYSSSGLMLLPQTGTWNQLVSNVTQQIPTISSIGTYIFTCQVVVELSTREGVRIPYETQCFLNGGSGAKFYGPGYKEDGTIDFTGAAFPAFPFGPIYGCFLGRGSYYFPQLGAEQLGTSFSIHAEPVWYIVVESAPYTPRLYWKDPYFQQPAPPGGVGQAKYIWTPYCRFTLQKLK